jgi:Zn-dependent protease
MNIDVPEVLMWVGVLLVALSVHESAHAWTADRLGDPTARHLGRVSLNPLVHADLFGTLLFPLIGLSTLGVAFGWAKPVPVNVGNLRNPRRDHTLVAAAGPLSNVALAVICFLFLFVLKSSSDSMELLVNQAMRGFGQASGAEGVIVMLASIADKGLMINILLAIFNMIPVAPLDGAAVVSGLLPPALARPFDAVQQFGFIILIAMLVWGLPAYVFNPVLGTVRSFLVL